MKIFNKKGDPPLSRIEMFKLKRMRHATTEATATHRLGGSKKEKGLPKPVTLAPMPWDKKPGDEP